MTRDPLAIMLQVAEHFILQAENFDCKVRSAVDAGADQRSILAIMDRADTSRLHALSAASAAAPYVQPKLSAVEIGPQSPLTQSRFAERIEALTDDEIVDALRQISAG